MLKVPLQKSTVRGPTHRREKERSSADLTIDGGDIGMLGRFENMFSKMHKSSSVSNIRLVLPWPDGQILTFSPIW